MDDIRKWFNGKKNYAEGVALYLKYGKDAMLKKLFTVEAESDFKKKKLVSALDEMLSGVVYVKKDRPGFRLKDYAPAILKKAEELRIENMPLHEIRWPDDRDETLQSLWLNWKALFGEMMNLSARIGDVARAGMKDPNKKEEAGRMALRILDLDDECDKLYAQRDFYLVNKKLPEDKGPVELSLDPNQWYKKLTNHQKYARTFRTRLNKDAADTEAAELLKKHEWAVHEYKKLLKMVDA